MAGLNGKTKINQVKSLGNIFVLQIGRTQVVPEDVPVGRTIFEGSRQSL